jgi:signal transduction histidine kinase
MLAESTPPVTQSTPSTLESLFVGRLLDAFVSLAQGDFSVRMERTGRRDAADTIAYLYNLMAEELGELFALRLEYHDKIDALIRSVTDVLVKIGAGELDARVERTFDGTPEDVLAYLVNSAAEEVQGLFQEREQKSAMLEEQATRQAIAERSAFSTLSAGVGHELNNPLTYAAGNIDFLEQELEDLQTDGDMSRIPELIEALQDARLGIQRAARIAADLKQLTPATEVELAPSNVADLIDSALTLIRNSVAHQAKLVCRYGEVPPVLADRGRLGQVLVNLVQNALHALPPDRPTEDNVIEVTTARATGRMAVIEVRDNGVGIAPENLHRIFESFFTTRPVGEGTGLGLAISKRMVADHGGHIEVESEVGVGSTFRIFLRVAEEAS